MSTLTVEPCYMPVDAAVKPGTACETIGLRGNDKVALIIPTLHEVESLRVVLRMAQESLEAANTPYEILVVDDDSQDGTEELVHAISRQDSRIRLLVRKGERGLSGAILYGWRHTSAEILGVMDADLQHPPELLPSLIEEMRQGRDVVVGSRYVSGGCLGGWNPLRKLISAAAVSVTLPLQRRSLRVADPMSGFFMVRRHCIQNFMFRPTGFKLLLEILVRGDIDSVSEIPFAFGRRCAGKSKASLRVAWDYLQLLLRLYGLRFFGEARVVEQAAGD